MFGIRYHPITAAYFSVMWTLSFSTQPLFIRLIDLRVSSMRGTLIEVQTVTFGSDWSLNLLENLWMLWMEYKEDSTQTRASHCGVMCFVYLTGKPKVYGISLDCEKLVTMRAWIPNLVGMLILFLPSTWSFSLWFLARHQQGVEAVSNNYG